MQQLTLKTIKTFKPTKEQIRKAEKVFFCMAKVDIIKPIVEKYQKEILEKHQFKFNKKDKIASLGKEKIVLNPEHTYRLTDKDFKTYLEDLHEQHLKHGFKVPFDYCPLLIAEANLIDAQREFTDSMSTLTTLKWSDITKLDDYKKVVDINLRFMVKYVRDTKTILAEMEG